MLNFIFKFSNSKLIKELIFLLNQLHVSHKSHVLQLIIIMYDIKVLKSSRFFCACCYLKLHVLNVCT